MDLRDLLNEYDPNLMPETVYDGGTVLARDMLEMLAMNIAPDIFDNPAEMTKRERYKSYESTYDFCVNEFGEKYTPDVKSVMDSVDKYLITIVKSANGVGKSHGAARIAIASYKRFDNVQVYTAAAPPESNLDIILWGQIRDLIAKHKDMFEDDNYGSGKYISRKGEPLSFIIGLPIPQSADSAQRKARFSGKHAPHLIFILDEGDAIPLDIYEAIESCMSGGYARLVVMFNPRADVGPLSRMEKTGRGNVVKLTAFSHPNVITGKNLYDGAVDRETTARRINAWSRTLFPREKPDAECFLLPEFLEGVVAASEKGIEYPPLSAGYRKITDPQLYYMILAEYPSMGNNQLVSKVIVEEAMARWKERVEQFGNMPPGRVRPVMGVDVSEMGNDWTVIALKYGSMMMIADMWQRKKVPETADECIGIFHRVKAAYCNVDANGVGAGVAPLMERGGCDPVNAIMLQSKPELESFSQEQREVGEFRRLRDYAVWSIKHWLENDPMAMLPPDDYLKEEILATSYEVENGMIVITSRDKYVEKIARSPDRLMAVALACMGSLDSDGAVALQEYNYIFGEKSGSEMLKSRKEPWRRISERV